MNNELINEYNKLEIVDYITANDSKNMENVQGLVVFKNDKGEVIDIRKNLVLMEARIHLFNHLFQGKKVGSTSEITTYNENLDRIICLFKIGSGGADVNGSPFTPYVPKFNDTDLGQPVPFIIQDPNKDSTLEGRSNPSIVVTLNDEQKKTYFLEQTFEDGTTKYYGKIFEPSSTTWKLDKALGKVAYSVTLRIEYNEARGFMFNELGLVLGKPLYDVDNTTIKNVTYPTLASRVTFDTKPLTDLTSDLEIEYIIYI